MQARRLLLMAVLALCAGVAQASPFEVVSYGDLTLRDNNLAGPAYQSSFGSWIETRVLYGDRSHAENLRPYIKLNAAASSEDIPEENTFTYGLGIEIRPMANSRPLAQSQWLDWLTRSRFFVEYLGQTSLRSPKPAWNPRHDFVFGFDAWREYGAVDEARRGMGDKGWGELWVGAAYHTTDFYLEDYDSLRVGLNAKGGAVLGQGDWPVMPYVVLDFNMTCNHDFFWQNRTWGGVGVRLQKDLSPEFRLKFWLEQRWLLDYLKAEPTPADGIPDSDTVLGVTFQYNRY